MSKFKEDYEIELTKLADQGLKYKTFIKEIVLPHFWAELHHEHEWTQGNNGMARWDRDWSTSCDYYVDLIKQTMELVGPVDFSHIGSTLLLGELDQSWFEQALTRANIEGQPIPNAHERNMIRKRLLETNGSK